jgi:GNAT superfamily N-acetyltransferase
MLVTELNRFLHSTTMKYFSFWDPTVHRKNAALLHPVISAECPEATFKKCWHLHGLFILPTCQRRGLGALALQWGIDQATSEHVPIVVNSSSKGVGLYEKMGFRGVMKQDFDQFFETGERGMWVMVWNPEDHGRATH